MATRFPNIINSLIREAQQDPSATNMEKMIPKHIIIKLVKAVIKRKL